MPSRLSTEIEYVGSADQTLREDRPNLYSPDFAHETQGHVELQAAMNVAHLPVHAISQWLMRGLGGRKVMESAPFIGEHPYPE